MLIRLEPKQQKCVPSESTCVHHRELEVTNMQSTQFLHSEIADWLQAGLQHDAENAQLSKAFRAFYRVRAFIPIWLRQILQRTRGGSRELSNDWFIPTELDSHLQTLTNAPKNLWPDDADYSFVLTHDVETADGIKLIPQIAKIEEELGFRSAWNLIPYKYRIDDGMVRDLKERGHEVGVHGYNHDGKLFLSKKIFQKRVPMINEAIRRYGASGFRAPMVHRNLDWLQELDVDYDSSCFDIDPLQAMPGGVMNLWPFQVGKFIELPYTMPQDHTLLIALGETTDRIWQEKLALIEHWNGMALLLTHPDYLETPAKQSVYRHFLEHVREKANYVHQLPMEVSQWTRQQLNLTNSVPQTRRAAECAES